MTLSMESIAETLGVADADLAAGLPDSVAGWSIDSRSINPGAGPRTTGTIMWRRCWRRELPRRWWSAG